jgi:3-hydroxyethyl bacteriochlorophyllide a dehydrogenase
MEALAVVLDGPESLSLSRLFLTPPGDSDVVVDVAWSGISTGTERLLFQGHMPPFPGMGYPLVPGYETVGRIVDAIHPNGPRVGDTVFVPGANCFGDVRGLFGGAASRLVVPAARVMRIDPQLREQGVLLALAATAYHALAHASDKDLTPDKDPAHENRFSSQPDLIVGHGVLGRLLARLVVLSGARPPVVWETNKARMTGATGYQVTSPDADPRRDYACICDASGDPGLLDSLIARLAPGGEIVLAGFYPDRVSFAFPSAFMREARFRVAAEFRPNDLEAARRLIEDGRLSLDGLVTHRSEARLAPDAYRTAFGDPACLKMILDWSASA